ncbi:hypothetical protein [Nocardia stercoris]|uniref:Uncharacterized protein n=1 Tax=Nocardia stercoris TaxID=2483361 RepID=A0A3M2LBC4_9NOCA|nr:hypothetical protein [Nocardia stercoris]RMI34040.1 hypothetical protein EBN03_06265 [Nocardia stercoris]
MPDLAPAYGRTVVPLPPQRRTGARHAAGPGRPPSPVTALPLPPRSTGGRHAAPEPGATTPRPRHATLTRSDRAVLWLCGSLLAVRTMVAGSHPIDPV